MITIKSLLSAVVVPFVLVATLLAQKAPAIYTAKGTLALSGYDAVSYFKDGKTCGR